MIGSPAPSAVATELLFVTERNGNTAKSAAARYSANSGSGTKAKPDVGPVPQHGLHAPGDRDAVLGSPHFPTTSTSSETSAGRAPTASRSRSTPLYASTLPKKRTTARAGSRPRCRRALWRAAESGATRRSMPWGTTTTRAGPQTPSCARRVTRVSDHRIAALDEHFACRNVVAKHRLMGQQVVRCPHDPIPERVGQREEELEVTLHDPARPGAARPREKERMHPVDMEEPKAAGPVPEQLQGQREHVERLRRRRAVEVQHLDLFRIHRAVQEPLIGVLVTGQHEDLHAAAPRANAPSSRSTPTPNQRWSTTTRTGCFPRLRHNGIASSNG